jgi:hypothetical protein
MWTHVARPAFAVPPETPVPGRFISALAMDHRDTNYHYQAWRRRLHSPFRCAAAAWNTVENCETGRTWIAASVQRGGIGSSESAPFYRDRSA